MRRHLDQDWLADLLCPGGGEHDVDLGGEHDDSGGCEHDDVGSDSLI